MERLYTLVFAVSKPNHLTMGESSHIARNLVENLSIPQIRDIQSIPLQSGVMVLAYVKPNTKEENVSLIAEEITKKLSEFGMTRQIWITET